MQTWMQKLRKSECKSRHKNGCELGCDKSGCKKIPKHGCKMGYKMA